MDSIIQVNGLKKLFGNEEALRDVTFSVKKGEVFGFLGPSGSGKTTTIKILTSQLAQTSGDATVFGVPVSELKQEQYRKRIGVLTDNSGLYTRLSIEENLQLYCDLYDEPRSRIDDVLQMVNLAGERKKRISALSRGMLQRVTLARALLHEPELLFLDEPTSALDPVNSRHIYKGIERLKAKGTTIFLTTHDMNEAEELCDRVAFLHQGEIQLLDAPKRLRRKYANGSMRVELHDGETVELKQGKDGADWLHEQMRDQNIAAIHSNEPTLGDIFIEVTGRKLS
ncbi:ABC transporter ATP-binding protein [Exiguobacterium sp. SL-9]|uniref:ABC transporter ATP-binding protein n=1 Tax=Exiguobacterium sp. SL-9 TaxID=2510963 RepID=UPI0010408C25|nr:ABC transporter ATP-binding protein [Exiguobacterium sp. SL-9]TCI20525.1 ABC transporter ATP-binding protein [Exiguobacterium sp. SL-9]